MKVKKSVSICLAIGCIFMFLQLCPFSYAKEEVSTSKGQTIMKQLANRDINAIQTKIQSIKEKLQLENVEIGSFSARFANTIIMGDSLAAGLLEYNILPDYLVMAERGNRTNNIDEDIRTVIGLNPKAIFMEYGINDLGYCRGNAELFASQYKEQIQKLKRALPNTKIYINSLTPISQVAQDKNEVYRHVEDFNKALQKVCKEVDGIYIDNTKLIDFSGDVYEYDGVHPHYPYYPIWLSHMLKVAGL